MGNLLCLPTSSFLHPFSLHDLPHSFRTQLLLSYLLAVLQIPSILILSELRKQSLLHLYLLLIEVGILMMNHARGNATMLLQLVLQMASR